MSFNQEEVQNLFQEYYILPVQTLVKHLQFRKQADPEIHQQIISSGYEWDEEKVAYIEDRNGQAISALPNDQFIWSIGEIAKHLKNVDKLKLWISGRGDDFLKKLYHASGYDSQITFKNTGQRGFDYVPTEIDPTNALLSKLTRQAGAKKELPSDLMIDVGSKAKKEGNQKVLDFLKTITPIEETKIKQSDLTSLIQEIVRGIVKEFSKVSQLEEKKFVYNDNPEQTTDVPDQPKTGNTMGKGIKGNLIPKNSKVKVVDKNGTKTGTSEEVAEGYAHIKSPNNLPGGADEDDSNVRAVAASAFGGTPQEWKILKDNKSEFGRVYFVYPERDTGVKAYFIWKTLNGVWKALVNKKWREIQLDVNPSEMTSTGAVAGYASPFAFKKQSKKKVMQQEKWAGDEDAFAVDESEGHKQRCVKCGELKDSSENHGYINGWVCPDCRKNLNEVDTVNSDMPGAEYIANNVWGNSSVKISVKSQSEKDGFNIFQAEREKCKNCNGSGHEPNANVVTTCHACGNRDAKEQLWLAKSKNGLWYYSSKSGGKLVWFSVPKTDIPNNISETTTGDVTGYNIPSAFAKKGGSKAGVEGSESLGYTLTPIGKKEMSRQADSLYEDKND